MDPRRLNWAFVTRVTSKPEDLRRELAAVEYETKTRGKRQVPAARPVGEGRYKLLRHGTHTEIAYALELPKEPGPAQEEFDIRDQASLIVSVKNPGVASPGAPSPPAVAEFPPELREKFGERRWIDIDDPRLLDVENAQVLLIGAHDEEAAEVLGVEIDEADESARSAEVCRELKLQCGRPGVRKTLFEGEFPDAERVRPELEPVEHPAPEQVPGRRGGRAPKKRRPPQRQQPRARRKKQAGSRS